jgi:Family of unknown function (DUF6491)
MKHPARVGIFGILLAGAQAAAQPAPPTSQPPAPPQRSCFLITELQGWRAPDARTIFIRANLNQFYRLDLAAACPTLTMPDAHLITKTRGPDLVCSAIDWDLSVAQPPPASIPEPCIVKKMTPLTPAEVAAIPPKFKP